MRGDRPYPVRQGEIVPLFTPHARGSTCAGFWIVEKIEVYPACAGIDPKRQHLISGRQCLPRMRGDRPSICACSALEILFTPHARGSTPCLFPVYKEGSVYPACAGIDPGNKIRRLRNIRLPRMRGDRPPLSLSIVAIFAFTPHARGSTFVRRLVEIIPLVYPACAGIDLLLLLALPIMVRLPRMRGDRPSLELSYLTPSWFTPHARGSTLFSLF